MATGTVKAQTPETGTCTRPLAEATLDVNNVRAQLFPAGILSYEVPAGGGGNAIQTTDIWFGGFVEGELRVAGQRWGGWEFWPGPLNPGARLPNPADCSAYDRMFEITEEDLEQYAIHGTISPNVSEWPWHLGAPVVDGDGDPSNYNPIAGDYPELIGEQRFWWVMNDVGNEHVESRSDPLGIEVQGTAVAVGNAPEAIRNTTVYAYRVINRLTVPIDSMFMGIYSQAGLGRSSTVFVGVDTTINMSYAYNSVNDRSSANGGPRPALGMVLIKGWPSASDELDNDYDGEVDEPGEEAGLSHFMQWCDDEDIIRAFQKYNTMTGSCKNGQPLSYGGRGFGGIQKTRFQWMGDPVAGAYWSAVNVDSMGTHLINTRPGSISSLGPFRLGPGELADFTFAYVWAQGKDNYDSITELRRAAVALQSEYEHYFLRQKKLTPPIRSTPSNIFLRRPHPNPASNFVTIGYTVAESALVRVELFDVLGRSTQLLVSEDAAAGNYSKRLLIRALAPGVYIYRASIGRASATGTLVIRR